MIRLQVNHWGPKPFRSGKSPRKSVIGGRFKIRRVDIEHAKPWRVWNQGKAFNSSKRFATQAEAIQWAQNKAMKYYTEVMIARYEKSLYRQR